MQTTEDTTDIELTQRHTELTAALNLLLADKDVLRIAVTVKHLYATGIDPMVICKALLVGDRDGTPLYALSCKSVHLAAQERHATRALSLALRGMSLETAVRDCVIGALFLATQHNLNSAVLRDLVTDASRRHLPRDLVGAGAVDLADNGALGRDRIWTLLGTIHPEHAPLELTPQTVRAAETLARVD